MYPPPVCLQDKIVVETIWWQVLILRHCRQYELVHDTATYTCTYLLLLLYDTPYR